MKSLSAYEKVSSSLPLQLRCTHHCEEEEVVGEGGVADGYQGDALPLCIDQRLVRWATCAQLSASGQDWSEGHECTIVQPEPRELSRINQADERHVGSGGNALVQLTLLRNRVFVTVEAGPCDVGRCADVDEVDIPGESPSTRRAEK